MRFLKWFYKDCYVYMVEGSNGALYTGMTWNIRKRILQHNGLRWGGSKYTSRNRPVFLVHLERFNSRKLAHTRELEIKKMSAGQKKALIHNTSKEQILSAI